MQNSVTGGSLQGMAVSNSSPQRTKALEIAQGVIVRAAESATSHHFFDRRLLTLWCLTLVGVLRFTFNVVKFHKTVSSFYAVLVAGLLVTVLVAGGRWYAGGAEQEAPYFLGYVEGRNIKFEHRFPNEIPNRNGGRPW